MDAMENQDANEDTTQQNLSFEGLLLGFVLVVSFIIVTAFIFAKLGIEPPRESGPLPWMAK